MVQISVSIYLLLKFSSKNYAYRVLSPATNCIVSRGTCDGNVQNCGIKQDET